MQEYDPDLPPELAAAAGIHDVPAENANPGKSDIGQSDVAKGPARVRPHIVCISGLCIHCTRYFAYEIYCTFLDIYVQILLISCYLYSLF